MIAVAASEVAESVPRLLPEDMTGAVATSSRDHAHLRLRSGAVASIVGARAPLLPNAMRCADWPRPPRVGDRVRVTAGTLLIGDLALRFAGSERVPTGVPRMSGAAWRRLAGRFAAGTGGADPNQGEVPATGDAEGIAAAREMADAVRRSDGPALWRAAHRLVGRGRGLTPEGDDVICGLAYALWASPGDDAGLLGACGGLCERKLTSALSATLLRLAIDGHAPAPIRAFLLDPSDRRAAAVARIGASSGRAMLAGIRLAVTAIQYQTNDDRRSA